MEMSAVIANEDTLADVVRNAHQDSLEMRCLLAVATLPQLDQFQIATLTELNEFSLTAVANASVKLWAFVVINVQLVPSS